MSNQTAEETKIVGKIIDGAVSKEETEKSSKSKWFKIKIQNNVTKYTLNGSVSKVEKSYFPLSGSEASRWPTTAQLAEHMNFCISESTKKLSYGYDQDLKLGVKTIFSKEKNPDSHELPSGCYQYHINPQTGEEGLTPFSVRADSYIEVDGALADTKRSIKKFLENKSIYRDKGIIYKLGIMMFGSPGQGKSMLLRHLINSEILKEAVVIFLNYLPANFLIKVREALGEDTLLVLVFEEFTEVEEKIKKNHQTDTLLQFLDGELSLDNSIVFATTNYPEKIPENIVNRPGRFDKLMYFGDPKELAIKKLLSTWLDREVTVDEIRAVTGLSAAAIREVCLLQTVEGYSFLEAAKVLLDRRKLCANKFKTNSPGFSV